jgi:transcription-repair coupling factor (superfamily II helicase)
MVIASIAADSRFEALKESLTQRRGVVHATGLWGSAARLVAARMANGSSRLHLFVTAHAEQADDSRDDLEFFLGRPCGLFPAWEALPGEGAASNEIEAERLRVCSSLMSRDPQVARTSAQDEARGSPHILVAPIAALMQPVPAPATLKQNTLTLRTGMRSARAIDNLVGWAVDRGFQKLEMVESPGDVARRGDIVDLFVAGESAPYRIQFDGETVESIRRFDVSSQRSIETLPETTVTAMPAAVDEKGPDHTPLFTYLPPDSVVILENPTQIQEMGNLLHARLGDPKRIYDISRVLAGSAQHMQLHLTEFGPGGVSQEAVFDFGVTSVSRFEGDAHQAVSELVQFTHTHEVHIVCDNEGERDRLSDMLNEQDAVAAEAVHFHLGILHRGFIWAATKTAVVAHHEIFQRHRQRRRIRRVEAGRPLESWTDLKPGELVVHVLHGIAVYRGLRKMRKGDAGPQEEFLTLEFADHAVVHVPTSQIDLVQKYIGAAGRRPQLSTIGGKRWSKTKEKVADSVSELAESLLRMQALRSEAHGTAYPDATQWQREFEAAFLYEETADQLSVAEEIRGDLCSPRPMDRLVCGDVGYGKTELAMRAAFKVVEFGRQVAVLVPTTVLAEQHYETFRERMADYPFAMECLSRFRSAAEQKQIVERIRRGQLDMVIGTHRLLSKDVAFANLGLVIIDEEQRFGVEHKERLRAMRETIDVLTLTATPIPRTLHMSLMGIRDISSLQTPPVDRRAIATQVRPFERQLIRDAILREMNRDGQVYFVHNYVQSIAAMAGTIAQIVPEARVAYGHGQMGDEELESVMHRFVRREADVLVATTIIESGIDIPSVNTIFINRADRFGLADLHQLRGRVGRSSHRAYCYLLLSPDRPVTSKAAKRLKTIEEFSELGAGFRIAMRDLEIRGAGNLLGREQSGHIAAVGYDLYCRLVEQSVRRLKNEPDPTPPAVNVDLDVTGHIPAHYIASDRSRIEIYRRIAACRTPADLTQLEKDLVDAFGPFPGDVQRLLELAEIRVLARPFGINAISLRPPDVVFMVDNAQAVEAVFADAPGTARVPDSKTVHLRLPPAYLERPTLLSVLRNLLARASAKRAAAAPVGVPR